MRWGQNIASHKSGSVIAILQRPEACGQRLADKRQSARTEEEMFEPRLGKRHRRDRHEAGDFLRVFHRVGDRDRSTIGMADENRPIEAHLVCRVDRFGFHPQACRAARARAKAVTGRSKATIWWRGTKAS